MSSPADYYKSLPPVSKAFGTICFLTTLGYHLQLVNPYLIMLDSGKIFQQFQVWRLVTCLFFLGPFSIPFGVRLVMIARYGVQLEKGPFDRRTADFLWMMIFSSLVLLGFGLLVPLLVPALQLSFMGPSLVFMLLHLWSREFANARVNIMGLFTLLGFYLPWVMLGLNVIFGTPLLPDLMGIVVGHLYYFFSSLHPRNGGQNILKTPLWVHKLVARWHIAGPQVYSPVPPASATRGTAFTGRSYRLQ